MNIDANKFITNLKISILRMYPFYGHILGQLPVVICNRKNNPQVPTMGVGKGGRDELLVKLFVNSDYINHVVDLCNRNEQQVVDHFTEVLKHEMHHLIFGHLNLELKDAQRATIACELSVNSYIDRSKLVAEPSKDGTDTRGVFPEDYGLPNGLGAVEYYNLLKDNAKFKNRHAKNGLMGSMQQSNSNADDNEQLANELDKLAKRQESAANASEKGKESNQSLTNRQSDISKDTQSAQGKTSNNNIASAIAQAMGEQSQAVQDLQNGDNQSAANHQHNAADALRKARNEARSQSVGDSQNESMDSHSMWGAVKGDEMTAEMIKDIVRKANETCKQMGKWGDVPGAIMQAIDECYESKKQIVPWEVVLKDFLASSSENVLDYTMKRKSKRYDTRPGTKKDDVLSVAIGIDTSGSIDNEVLEMFFSELHWMDKTGTKMRVFEWDTQVNKEYDFSEFDGTITGRGGTDPTDFLKKATEQKYDCIIVFTDLEFAPIKDEYNVPMLWVVFNNWYYANESLYDNVPSGIIMKVNEDRDGFDVVRR